MKQLRKPPKYCQGFEDRHGKMRWYFRRPGFQRRPLPGLPWSPQFMAAYSDAMESDKAEVGKAKVAPGSVAALVASYYRSAEFIGLAESTKRAVRNILERFRAEHGEKRVAHMEKRHVQRILAEKVSTPDAANRLLRLLRSLMVHAVDLGWRRDDPTLGIKKMRHRSEGFETWQEDHIAAFLDHHKPGTRAHLALSLLLHTGQRRGDVVRMGRQHVKAGVLTIVQQKTGQEVSIPLHPELRASLDSLPKDNLTFILSDRGKPLTPEGFTNWFNKMVKAVVDKDGNRLLPDGLSPHGLRKATCRRLAEAGCSAHEIMSISGHQTLAEVTRYTVAANRIHLAERAVAALGRKEQ
ncbi:tyrosine-type recombinase/integrase [Rhodovulum steppense]|uniref:Site-specific recombinase XerD n=1 Tax=Rhodovulum steppense TaxID=540251 RepID=A0A4R1YVK2_9RHOB|nr:tyrosine-type recombinase/integrase [Rhodovulum steppense]TCM85168.1 site-specific recombinase XerD [Rhodovulum steppense]